MSFRFVGVHLYETPYPLLLFFRGIIHVGTSGKHARIGAEIREGADEGVGRDLEREAGKGLVVRGFPDFLFARIGIGSLDVIDVERAGQEMNDRVEQELHSLVFIGRTAKHGNHFHFQATDTQTLNNFLGRKIPFLKIFFHQLVAGRKPPPPRAWRGIRPRLPSFRREWAPCGNPCRGRHNRPPPPCG